MLFNISKYNQYLDILSTDLFERLDEKKIDHCKNIRIVVDRVMNRFRVGLESSQKAKEDFIQMRLENWDDKVFLPLSEFAHSNFTSILKEETSLAQQIDSYDSSSEELLLKEIKACRKKKENLLKQLKDLERSEAFSDEESDDSLHLEEL